MSSFLPTLKQLQYLVALKEHGHFGKAAESCFVTQSTLSAGLRELETLLDCNLVERTRRVVRFTPLGDAIVERAYTLLREAEELSALAKASGQPLVGEMRMSVIPTVAPFLLPHLLPQLRREKPELKLYLREEISSAACESLHHGQADCILLAMPFACGEVEHATLFSDSFHVAFPADNPIDPPDQIDPAWLDETQLLLLEDGHCLKDHVLSACNRPELSASATMIGTSLHTLVQMVDNRLGMTLLPDMAIKSGILSGTNIITRPLHSDQGSREICLAWRKNSPRKEEFHMLADILQRGWEAAA
ncbi:hydrogen peroxide-inducible genes activator [Parasphingorhabdus sp. DH2-15]|jgi:LysR family hydrogen peroxide-inducible transcriptional activator|uniref:hydrogen peroxide-inducible genes activator n=1 Tax=Parasphingorhabdus sp. DH2-15 TaxID=3444112 RepID=UPI003F686DF2